LKTDILRPKRRWAQFSVRSLLVLTALVGVGMAWWIYEPYRLAKRLRNTDIHWDGNYFGLDARVAGETAVALVKYGRRASPALLGALEDGDKFAAAHVVLTHLWQRLHSSSGEEWNHLRVSLYGDGRRDFHPEQIPAIRAYWLDVVRNGSALSDLPFVEVADDERGFVVGGEEHRFVPWGFNYDHDEQGRLLEDYWETEWPKVESDFAEMKALGANVVRVHLQLGKFMSAQNVPNRAALERLSNLVALAERQRLYLDLTGLGCYHKADVPAWYDQLTELERWDVQARFWQAVAAHCADSPAIFCYDLMNEPVVPGGRRDDGDWLAPPFAGKHFVQFVTLDQRDRPRVEIAQAWIRRLVAAIRRVDKRHLITLGLVDWSLEGPGLTSGFVPAKVVADLDFVCVHVYPEKAKFDEAARTLEGFSVGKPLVVEETFPLRCSPEELGEFIDRSREKSAGWISFYWGKPKDELRKSAEVSDAILLDWLERFEKRSRAR
jgi:hypothetical protein